MKVILSAIVAGVLTALLTPLVIRLSHIIGAVDVPRDGRRLHRRPIPRCGGLALFVAFLLTVSWTELSLRHLRALIAGGMVLIVLGILDDVFRLSAWLKLVVQTAAAGIAVSGGFNGSMWAWGVAVLWVVALINAHNMIDGLDGLATGIGGTEAAALTLVFFLQGRGEAAGAALVMLGVCVGFLAYNRHPARIFLGDTGSQFLGFILGVLSLQIDRAVSPMGAFIAPLIFALPLSDLIFAVVRRTLRGQSPFAADRGHFHHRLYDAGWGQRGSCAWLRGVSALLGGTGVLLCHVAWYGYAVYLIFSVIAVLLLLEWLNELRQYEKNASFEK